MTARSTILFVPEFFPPELQYSAFAERCRALAIKLGSSGLDLRVLVLRRTDITQPLMTSDTYEISRRPEHAMRFHFANLPANTLQRVGVFWDILFASRSYDARAIVISAHDPFFYHAALLVGRILRIPVVTDAHDSRLVMGAVRRARPSRFVKLRLERLAMSWAFRVWVPTASLAKLLETEYRLPPDRFTVVPNGAQLDRFLPVASSPATSPRFLHLGGPRAYYDSAALIVAFRSVAERIPGAALEFLGIRNDSYTKFILAMCRSAGLADAVHFFPPVPANEVASRMSGAIAGIHTYALHPVYATTVGLKVMEYMAAGLPVIHRGPRDGETWRIIEENGVGLCAESDEELAAAMVRIASDSDLRQRLGAMGRLKAFQLDWDTVLSPAVKDISALMT